MATQKRKLKLMSIVLAFVVLAVLVVTLLPLVVFATRTSKPAIHNAASTTQLQSSYSEPGWWRPCTHTYLNQATNHQVCDAWNQSWDLTKNPLPCDTTNYKDQTGVASTSLTNWRGIDVCGPRPNSSSAKDDNYVQFSKPDGSANKDSSVEQEFECTELVKRYLRLAYGLDAISANGGQLVGAYTAKHPDFFHSVNNDENVKIQMFPAEGDVLSFSYNHTAIVKSVSITNSISGNADIVIIEQNYSSSGIRPLKMTNWKIDGDNVSSWMTLRPVPAIPGGVWKSPTPADGSLQIPGTWVNVSAHAVDNSGQGLTKVYITESLEGTNNWGIVQPWYTSGVVGSADVSGSVFMPQIQNVLVSFDVYSNNGLQNLAPNGIRRFCPSSPCSPYNSPGQNQGGGTNNPTPTPSQSDGFQVCGGVDYSQPCETFKYNGDNNHCIGLDQVAGHSHSVRFIGSYVGNFSAVMYHDSNCGTYLARYDSDKSDIGWGLYDQFNSMRLEKHQPPPAGQVSPANGSTLDSGTTEIDVSYTGQSPFTLHVWCPNSHYDLWQANIQSTTYHVAGLSAGANCNWQISGNVGGWSATWTFSVASATTPTPSPTDTPTSVPTQTPTPTPTPDPGGGSIQLCSLSNFSGDCENFVYPGSNDQCMSLDRIAGNSDSLRYLGNYAGHYHLDLYHDSSCSVFLSAVDHDNSDFGLLQNQYVAIKINYTG